MNEIPAAMFIEMSQDSIQTLPPQRVQAALKELHTAVGDSTGEFQRGYILGLTTASTMSMLRPARPVPSATVSTVSNG